MIDFHTYVSLQTSKDLLEILEDGQWHDRTELEKAALGRTQRLITAYLGEMNRRGWIQRRLRFKSVLGSVSSYRVTSDGLDLFYHLTRLFQLLDHPPPVSNGRRLTITLPLIRYGGAMEE